MTQSMIKTFGTADINNARAKLKLYLRIFVLLTLVMIVGNALFVMFRHEIGRGLAKFLNIVVTALYLVAMLFLYELKYRPVRKYNKMHKYILTGLKEEYTGKFLRFEEDLTDKEGVNFYLMIVEEKVKKRPDMPERRVLIEQDVPKPDLREGDKVRYITHASILLEYEIVERADERQQPLEI